MSNVLYVYVCVTAFLWHSVGRQIVNVPSFNVRVESEKHIEFSLQSTYGGGRDGTRLFCFLLCVCGGDGGFIRICLRGYRWSVVLFTLPALSSACNPGRVKRKRAKAAAGGDDE
jgi:hypothetical protein